jgi:hypothetical protein
MTKAGHTSRRRRRLSADALEMRRAIERRLFGGETISPATLSDHGDHTPPVEEIDLTRKRRDEKK